MGCQYNKIFKKLPCHLCIFFFFNFREIQQLHCWGKKPHTKPFSFLTVHCWSCPIPTPHRTQVCKWVQWDPDWEQRPGFQHAPPGPQFPHLCQEGLVGLDDSRCGFTLSCVTLFGDSLGANWSMGDPKDGVLEPLSPQKLALYIEVSCKIFKIYIF